MPRFLLASLPVFLMAAPALVAEESGTPTIITDSPFLPPNFTPPGGSGGDPAIPVSASQYEFRGVYQMGGKFYFNLYNKRDNDGTWVTESESDGESPRIVSYNIDEDVLVVELAGKRVSLELVETSDRAMPVVTAPRSSPTTLPATANQQTTGEAGQAPVRRRIIRPTTRSTPAAVTRRPTNSSSNSQQQQP